MEFINGIIQKIFNIDILMVVGIVTGFNAIIVSLAKFFELIKDKTESDVDNKIYKYLNFFSNLILKALNVISARGK